MPKGNCCEIDFIVVLLVPARGRSEEEVLLFSSFISIKIGLVPNFIATTPSFACSREALNAFLYSTLLVSFPLI